MLPPIKVDEYSLFLAFDALAVIASSRRGYGWRRQRIRKGTVFCILLGDANAMAGKMLVLLAVRSCTLFQTA